MNPTTRHRRIARYLGGIARIALHAAHDSDARIATYRACPISAPLRSIEIYNTHMLIIYETDIKRIEYGDISRIFAYPASMLPRHSETEDGFMLRLTLQDPLESEDIFFPYAGRAAMCAIWSYLVSGSP